VKRPRTADRAAAASAARAARSAGVRVGRGAVCFLCFRGDVCGVCEGRGERVRVGCSFFLFAGGWPRQEGWPAWTRARAGDARKAGPFRRGGVDGPPRPVRNHNLCPRASGGVWATSHARRKGRGRGQRGVTSARAPPAARTGPGQPRRRRTRGALPPRTRAPRPRPVAAGQPHPHHPSTGRPSHGQDCGTAIGVIRRRARGERTAHAKAKTQKSEPAAPYRSRVTRGRGGRARALDRLRCEAPVLPPVRPCPWNGVGHGQLENGGCGASIGCGGRGQLGRHRNQSGLRVVRARVGPRHQLRPAGTLC
jgi:hypothetical protein